jgi:hypothetical protein
VSALGAAVGIIGAIVEAAKGGLEIYKAVRSGHDVTVVRAPRGLADRARAEAERRQRKGSGR